MLDTDARATARLHCAHFSDDAKLLALVRVPRMAWTESLGGRGCGWEKASCSCKYTRTTLVPAQFGFSDKCNCSKMTLFLDAYRWAMYTYRWRSHSDQRALRSSCCNPATFPKPECWGRCTSQCAKTSNKQDQNKPTQSTALTMLSVDDERDALARILEQSKLRRETLHIPVHQPSLRPPRTNNRKHRSNSRQRSSATPDAAATSSAAVALKQRKQQAYGPAYKPDEESLREDFAQEYVNSGRRPQNFLLGTDLDKRFDECVYILPSRLRCFLFGLARAHYSLPLAPIQIPPPPKAPDAAFRSRASAGHSTHVPSSTQST